LVEGAEDDVVLAVAVEVAEGGRGPHRVRLTVSVEEVLHSGEAPEDAAVLVEGGDLAAIPVVEDGAAADHDLERVVVVELPGRRARHELGGHGLPGNGRTGR